VSRAPLLIDNAADGDGWTELGTTDDLFGQRACRALKVCGHHVGLFRVEGEILAVDNICTHGNAQLTDGEVEGSQVECPLHAGVFDLRTGKALTAPLNRDVRAHAVRSEGGKVFLQLRLVR